MPRPMKAWARLLMCGDGKFHRIWPPKTLPEIIAVMTLRSRFEDRGYKTKCHIWIGSTSSGYGTIRIANRLLRTHCAAWRFYYGEIPEGKEVCHRCDQKDCWQADHLFIGTHHENMLDAAEKKLMGGPIGEAHYCARFTESKVRELRNIFATHPPTKEMATQYGVSYAALIKIQRWLSWKHI